jgi:RimJ/RimL family protein N-acetyltransferase
MSTPIVRKLTARDASAFQALRLEGLANHPCEFGTAYEEEVDLPSAEIERRLEQGKIFGAFVDGKLAAIAGFRRFDRLKKQHKAELFGVYVGKEARGKKLGEAVVRHVIAVAKGEAEQLLATVASLNQPAKALYAKLGFIQFGHEPRAHKVGDRYYDQDHLLLMLI